MSSSIPYSPYRQEESPIDLTQRSLATNRGLLVARLLWDLRAVTKTHLGTGIIVQSLFMYKSRCANASLTALCYHSHFFNVSRRKVVSCPSEVVIFYQQVPTCNGRAPSLALSQLAYQHKLL